MKTHIVLFTLCTIAFTHIMCADESTSPQERYKKMYAQAQEEVKSKEAEILAGYEQQPHPAERLQAEKEFLTAHIQQLETRIEQCMDGTISEEVAAGCENKDFYIVLHAMKRLLKHIDQKIAAEKSAG